MGCVRSHTEGMLHRQLADPSVWKELTCAQGQTPEAKAGLDQGGSSLENSMPDGIWDLTATGHLSKDAPLQSQKWPCARLLSSAVLSIADQGAHAGRCCHVSAISPELASKASRLSGLRSRQLAGHSVHHHASVQAHDQCVLLCLPHTLCSTHLHVSRPSETPDEHK